MDINKYKIARNKIIKYLEHSPKNELQEMFIIELDNYIFTSDNIIKECFTYIHALRNAKELERELYIENQKLKKIIEKYEI